MGYFHEVDAMAMINEHINNRRFHVVGIGYAPNSFLVKQLAKTGRGALYFLSLVTWIITQHYYWIRLKNQF